MVSDHFKCLKRYSFPLFLSFLFLIGACASTAYRIHPEFETRITHIGHPVLMPPDVKVYETLPAGMVVLRDDWSTAGRQNLQQAVVNAFHEKNCTVKTLPFDVEGMEIKAEMEEVQSLYRVVNKTIRLQAYGSPSHSDKNSDFKYSVGSIEQLLTKLEADSALFICGLEQVSENETKAVVNLALVDASGTIIWYSVEGFRGRRNLTNFENALELVDDLITSFPKVKG
jgi:hypothetical protein